MTQKFKNIVMTFLLSLVAGTLVAQDVFPTAPTDTLYTQTGQFKALPLSQGVSPSGAYTVSVPIETYAGVGDAQPQISLNYNSQQGNGLLGMGWSLSGISTISTGYWSLYYDGTTKSPATSTLADTTDALYLDGVRLVTSGSGYVTVTGNTKVSRMSTTGNYVNTFKAMYADGSQATYVRTGLKQYSISTFTDRNGNTMSYTYDTDSPVAHLTKITYNGTHATVEFEYDTSRTDPVITYFGGYKHTETKRLKAIRTKLDGVIQRYYQLIYSASRSASVLNYITCQSVNRSAETTIFSYGEGQPTSGFNSSTLHGMGGYNFTKPDTVAVYRGKMGERFGTDDDVLVHHVRKEPFRRDHHNHKHYFESQYTGIENIYIYSGLDNGSGGFTDPMPTIQTGAGFVQMMFADVDPSPGEELIRVNSRVANDHDMLYFTVYTYSLYTGIQQLYTRSFDMGVADIYHESYQRSPWPRDFYTADINGDGRWEVLSVSLDQPLGYTNKRSRCQVFDLEHGTILSNFECFPYELHYTGRHEPSNADRLYVLDLNGDGKSDLMHINSTGIHVYEFSGTSSVYNSHNITTFNKTNMTGNIEQLVWGDYNGDGFPDFIKRTGTQAGLYFGKGNCEFEKSTISVPNNSSATRTSFGQDLNGDGHTDLVQ